jgi:long-chain acyl-CoA synthetase
VTEEQQRAVHHVKTYPEWPNLPAMMLDRAATWPDRPMLRHFQDGGWHQISWGEFGRRVRAVAGWLRGSGFSPGDRVLMVSENRPEYPIAETALMALQIVPVPAYVSNTVEDHAHIIRDSGARTAIVSSPTLAERARTAGMDGLLVVMDEPPEGTIPWAELLRAPPIADLAAQAATIEPTALAVLLYTSGTGGAPKGVMLPHSAILSNCRGAVALLREIEVEDDEVYLSYLPVAHSYEHTVGNFLLPSAGCEIVYARGVEHLAADMLTIQPTILTAVPRVLELIRARILSQVSRQPAWKRALFQQALAIGAKRADGRPLSFPERLVDPLLDRLVRAKIRARFGGRIKGIVSGAARLEPEVGRFFLAMGLLLIQGYGQTEAGPVISANPPLAGRIDTVGKALEGVELRIADDSEILVRGGLVMQGYWNRSSETAAAIRDGWLHTGDIGSLDADGYLRITDRKKDMIVLSGGENVSPARVEGLLVAEPEIAQAVIVGDGASSVSALLVSAEGIDAPAVGAAVARVNARLSITERIRHHVLVPAFSIENGLLTPSQKVRRREVICRYRHLLA